MQMIDSASDEEGDLSDDDSVNDLSTQKRDYGTLSSEDNESHVQKQSRKLNSISWDNIPLTHDGSVSHQKMVEYRKAIDTLISLYKHVDDIKLPEDPLDRLVNKRCRK